ncbi:MAG: hypothetical protein QN135_03495 [Armatimonadota bacterium]|nr:hypothetical protein [Armatimonadota bacterium]
MALPDRIPDPFTPSIADVERRIAELNEQRRRIWRASMPDTGAGETGRRTLAEIEAELEFLYQTKRQLLARKDAPAGAPSSRRRSKTAPAPPAGLFADE